MKISKLTTLDHIALSNFNHFVNSDFRFDPNPTIYVFLSLGLGATLSKHKNLVIHIKLPICMRFNLGFPTSANRKASN